MSYGNCQRLNLPSSFVLAKSPHERLRSLRSSGSMRSTQRSVLKQI